jgi:hypothetical protein
MTDDASIKDDEPMEEEKDDPEYLKAREDIMKEWDEHI